MDEAGLNPQRTGGKGGERGAEGTGTATPGCAMGNRVENSGSWISSFRAKKKIWIRAGTWFDI
jgi:hypothetical protein